MDRSFFSTHLAASPVIAIIRGLAPEQTAEVAARCWAAGIALVEVPARDEAALAALRAAAEVASGHEDRILGAGSICSVDDVERAAEAGARFLVAPGVFPSSIAAAAEAGLPLLPGVMTPTDVFVALDLGLSVQKLFPAASVSTDHISALHGPFPQVSFVAVGGVTPENAKQFLAAGAIGVGVGSSILQPGGPERFSSLVVTR